MFYVIQLWGSDITSMVVNRRPTHGLVGIPGFWRQDFVEARERGVAVVGGTGLEPVTPCV
tara:strand:- start:643 stop:822 length:180 start_codon:yes stop_codon:yes gene_type:complete